MKVRRYVFLFLLLGMAFFVQVRAQDIKFPNEIKGFELYGRGKLSDIRLGISSREDVERIWGKACWGGGCDYDENWEIAFYYFFEDSPVYKIEGDNFPKLIHSTAAPGNVRVIVLHPRKTIFFKDVLFSAEFEVRAEEAVHSGSNILVYTDSRGLCYTILNENFGWGNLIDISYGIPYNQVDDEFGLTALKNILPEDPN